MAKINFQGVKTEFEPVPGGIYESKFHDYKFGLVKTGANQGQRSVNLQFAITEEGVWKNRRLFRFCTFTQESLWAFKRTMSALGAEVDWEDPEGIDDEEVCKSVKGAPCILVVSIRENEVEDPVTHEIKMVPQNNVDDVKPTEVTRLRQAEAQPEVVESGQRAR